MSYGNRGYSRGGGFGGPKPVEVGKQYDVQIAEISRKGDGIARIQGFVIFVKGGRVGEKTKITISSVGERFAIAEKADGPTAETKSEGEQKQVAPPVAEAEKPELQDYKSEETPEKGSG